jgi:hypothetical protein
MTPKPGRAGLRLRETKPGFQKLSETKSTQRPWLRGIRHAIDDCETADLPRHRLNVRYGSAADIIEPIGVCLRAMR